MEKLLSRIIELYGVSVYSPQKVERGFLSENHILTDGSERYFLKKYRFNKEEKIQEIHAAKHYFANGGVPVILPVLNSEEKTYFEFEGGYFALFPYVDGRHIERDSLGEVAAISLGEMLGKIHLLGKDSQLPMQEDFGGWNKEKLIAKAEQLISIIREKDSLDEFDRNALEVILFKRGLIESNTASLEDLGLQSDCLIHGDYHEGNIFFDKNDNVQNVFDFEKTGYAPRVFEVIRSMLFMFFNGGLEIQRIELARVYIESYSKIYPISQQELTTGLRLFYLRQMHGFWVETEHYINNNYRVDQFLMSGYKSTRYLSENLENLAEKLFS